MRMSITHAGSAEGKSGGGIDAENQQQQAGDNHSDDAQHFRHGSHSSGPFGAGVQPVRYHVFTLV